MKKKNQNQRLSFDKITVLDLNLKKQIRGGNNDPHETTKNSKNCPPDGPVSV
ncbi:hypothetical protein FLACOL_01947 [Flavobacterium columnare]|uniref:Natural product n=2 Tax=Flavobacterium TaxID=237 RepID=A0ABW8PLM1_9FLAO|nr:hypothetical protein [Flavobacterium columnare]SPE77933.1 hypothetical protein FLACOL_01947 [Flavobacterium columnare]